MDNKKQRKGKNAGLGRSLGELLSDNEELGNVENKVLMHKNDGTTVKIYNKVDAKGKSDVSKKVEKSSIEKKKTTSNFDDDRLYIGKTREEREEEARGIYRSGKPHVIPEGDYNERIRISANPKAEPEAERIVLDGSKLDGKGVSDALGKLKRYSPRASDEFLEALRDMDETVDNRDYPTDKNGRIIIGAGKSRVKKR